jgi:hypothetical protein
MAPKAYIHHERDAGVCTVMPTQRRVLFVAEHDGQRQLRGGHARNTLCCAVLRLLIANVTTVSST